MTSKINMLSHRFHADDVAAWLKRLPGLRDLPTGLLNSLDEWLVWSLILIVSWSAGQLIHRLTLRTIRRLHASHPRRLLAALLQHKVSSKLAYLFPPVMAGALLQAAFNEDTTWLTFNERLMGIVFVVATVRFANALINSVGDILMSREGLHNRPMKGVVEILQVACSGIGVIVVFSIVTDKSPLSLITGLSAFAAVLMLVFRDTILGFVAGVMLAKSDMVRIGDRIVMERCGAEGTVIDIDLTTVKVQNMDYTMVTIPPYTLLTESFFNWRPLYADGVRRVLVEVTIRPSSVRDDNLPLFRQYLAGYLKAHPDILQDRLQMVRLLTLQPEGIPLQVYAFTSRVGYKEFNEVLSKLTEHVVALAPEFGLKIFEWTEEGMRGEAPGRA
jgi:miniconductance mechanosensitive channel